MFARRVINRGFGRQGKVAKKGDANEITRVLKEISLNEPTKGNGKLPGKGQAKQTVQPFFKKPPIKPLTKPVNKRITALKKDALPTNLPIAVDSKLQDECIEEPFDALYAQDIHMYLKSIESKCCPGLSFMDADITASNRRILVRWMRNVQEFLKVHQETFHLAVTITDLIVEKGNVKLQEYQLLGLVGFLIAAKYLERYVPEIDTLMYLASDAYDYQAIIAKEKEVLQMIDYDLNLPTTSWFLDYYTRDDNSQKIQDTAALFLDLFILHDESVAQFPPSLRAASSLMIANETFSRPKEFWQRDLELKSAYSRDRLEPANQKLKELISGLYTKTRCSLENDIVAALPAIASV